MSDKVLFICGSLNQTTMMHKISKHLKGMQAFFTPFYSDGILDFVSKTGALDFSILGGNHLQATSAYLKKHKLPVDFAGKSNSYSVVVTCTDLIVQKNIQDKRLILVQEGMTEPEGLLYHLVKDLKLPRYLANTSVTGLSDAYDAFCVASYGYRDLFIKKGVKAEKIEVTGIPNFDNAVEFLENDFPYKDFILLATSSIRETIKFDNRVQFLRNVKRIAGDRNIIVKLHPNENEKRARRELRAILPDAKIFTDGNVNHMIANCKILITQYSSVVYTGIALNKEIYSYYNIDTLKKLTPIQNGGISAKRIANICRQINNVSLSELRRPDKRRRLSCKLGWVDGR